MKTILKEQNLTHAQHVRRMRALSRSYQKGHPARRNLMEEARDHARKKEARSVHVAYSFLRGRTYSEVENDSRTAPDWDRIQELVEKFGSHYYVDRNITASEDLFASFAPCVESEHDRIVVRSSQKKVRVRPTNR